MKTTGVTNVECARFNNLVYARTLKAGSEFFYRNFTETAGWEPCVYQDINWSNDIVFSYIMDPIQRRHKGVSEFIIAADLVDLLLSDQRNIGKLMKVIPFLDGHSASLHHIYGDCVDKMHWILMTNDHQVAIRETEAFLAKHSAPPINWNVEFTHATGAYMSEIYTRIKSQWEWTADPCIDDTVRSYFQRDIDLYNRVQRDYARNHSS